MIQALSASTGLAMQDPAFWMPLALFCLLLALILGAVLLDGFDIGVGLLVRAAPASQRTDLLVALSPWREANEFWMILTVGLFVAAFPVAWGDILSHLFIPLTMTAIGSALRGVSFEYRVRSDPGHRLAWVRRFWLGSLLTAFGHGLMLAIVVTGYPDPGTYVWFGLFIGVCAVAAYALLGATWLVMRKRGALQSLAAAWARHAIRWAAAGMVAVSLALGLTNPAIFYKWTSTDSLMFTMPVWLLMLMCFVAMDMILLRVTRPSFQKWSNVPFYLCALLMTLMAGGLAYSVFPFVVLDRLTIWDAAAALSSLQLVLSATIVAVPVMLIFNLFAYRSMFSSGGAQRDP